jgi:hypothetical protein
MATIKLNLDRDTELATWEATVAIVKRFVGLRLQGHSPAYVKEVFEQKAVSSEIVNREVRAVFERFPDLVLSRCFREKGKKHGKMTTFFVRDGYFVWRYGLAPSANGAGFGVIEEVVPTHEYDQKNP